jgi:hypothetical protein
MPAAGQAMRSASVRNIRRSLDRLAPIDRRMAISFRRAAALASDSDATLALAMATSNIRALTKIDKRISFRELSPGSSIKRGQHVNSKILTLSDQKARHALTGILCGTGMYVLSLVAVFTWLCTAFRSWPPQLWEPRC